jgi:hypothetical protein
MYQGKKTAVFKTGHGKKKKPKPTYLHLICCKTTFLNVKDRGARFYLHISFPGT